MPLLFSSYCFNKEYLICFFYYTNLNGSQLVVILVTVPVVKIKSVISLSDFVYIPRSPSYSVTTVTYQLASQMNSPSHVAVAMVRRLWAERDKAIRWRLLTDMDDSCISQSVSAHTPIKGLDFHLLGCSRFTLDVLLYKAYNFTMRFTSRCEM